MAVKFSMKHWYILIKLCFLVCFLGTLAQATWVWNPETGWINTKYNPTEDAKVLYQQAQKLQQAREYAKAAELFQSIAKAFPNTPEAQKSLYEGAECHTLAENYYDAYIMYEEYRSQNPYSEKTNEILAKEYEIGCILIRGKASPTTVLGFAVLSSAPLGAEILQKIITDAPYISFADDAQLTIANYYFKEEDYFLATENYEKLVKEYPKSEWVNFAQYQIAICWTAQFKGIEYDVKCLRDAQRKLEEHDKKYPQSQYLSESQAQQQKIQDTLAQKELMVAQYYLDHDQIPGAKMYLMAIVQNFAGTPTAQKAQTLLQELNSQK